RFAARQVTCVPGHYESKLLFIVRIWSEQRANQGMSMSRSKLSVRLSVGLVLASGMSLAVAQGYVEPGVMIATNKAATVNEETLRDVNLMAVNDPHEVDILFKEGAPLV